MTTITCTATDSKGATAGTTVDATATSVTTAPIVTVVRPASTLNPLFQVSTGGTTTSNNITVFGTSIYGAGNTVRVYFSGVLKGTCLTNSIGQWNFAPGIIADAAHTITATITVGGVTSALSSSFVITIAPTLTSLPSAIGVNIPDSRNFNIDGWAVSTESNNGGPSNPNTCIPTDTHTVSMTILPTDVWLTNWCRDELQFTSRQTLGQTYNITYEFQLSAASQTNDIISYGAAGAGQKVGHLTITQLHDIAAGSGLNSEIYGMNLGVNGIGDACNFVYVAGGSNTYPNQGTSPLSRGTWHTMDIILKTGASPNAMLKVWLDGVQAVNATGVGIYGSTNVLDTYYWKMGIYMGTNNPPAQIGTPDRAQTVLYRNVRMVIS